MKAVSTCLGTHFSARSPKEAEATESLLFFRCALRYHLSYLYNAPKLDLRW